MDYTEAELDGFQSRMKAIYLRIGKVLEIVRGDLGACSPEQSVFEYKFSLFADPDLHAVYMRQLECLETLNGIMRRIQLARSCCLMKVNEEGR